MQLDHFSGTANFEEILAVHAVIYVNEVNERRSRRARAILHFSAPTWHNISCELSNGQGNV